MSMRFTPEGKSRFLLDKWFVVPAALTAAVLGYSQIVDVYETKVVAAGGVEDAAAKGLKDAAALADRIVQDVASPTTQLKTAPADAATAEAETPASLAPAQAGQQQISAEQLAGLQQVLALKPDACPTGRDESKFRMFVGDPANNVIACVDLGGVAILNGGLMIPLAASDRPGYVEANLADAVGPTPDPEFCARVLKTITPYVQEIVSNELIVPDDTHVPLVIHMGRIGSVSPCDSDFNPAAIQTVG